MEKKARLQKVALIASTPGNIGRTLNSRFATIKSLPPGARGPLLAKTKNQIKHMESSSWTSLGKLQTKKYPNTTQGAINKGLEMNAAQKTDKTITTLNDRMGRIINRKLGPQN